MDTNDTQQKQSVKDGVISAIKNGKATMKSKAYFIARTSFLIFGIGIGFAFLVYFASLIVFRLHANGAWFAPRFGFHGIGIFFRALPWLLVMISLVFVVVLEIAVRKYGFAWRRPVVYSVVAIAVISVIAGLGVSRTSLHKEMFRRAKDGRIPVAGFLYHGLEKEKLRGLHIGTVSGLTDSGFLLQSHDGNFVNVEKTPETMFSFRGEIAEGDIVVVMGEKAEGDSVSALGIRKMDHDENMFPWHDRMMGGGSWRGRLERIPNR